MTAFNPWVNQGNEFASTPSVFSPGQPTVIYEGGSQLGLGGGNVFKMWYNNVHSPYGVYYAESTTGLAGSWTQSPSNPIIASVGGGTKVFKHGSTYYLYCGPGNFTGTSISAYTSSDGVTWTLQNASAVVPGSAGAFDSLAVFQLAVCAVDGTGKWWGYYAGEKTAVANIPMGLVTSTDGIHWTKDPGNPVASMSSGTLTSGAPWTSGGNFTFASVGGSYYGWQQICLTNSPGPGAGGGLPSDLLRWVAPAPSGPWTPLGSLTYYRTVSTEGVNSGKGQVADPTIVAALGNIYLYYTAVPDGTAEATNGYINGAVATGMTLAQLVAGVEGVHNVPIPFPGGAQSLNFSVSASDNFHRANANPIGGNWSPIVAGATSQIVSNVVEPTTPVTLNGDSFYNALSWPADQWGQITDGGLAVTNGIAGVSLRMNISGVFTSYRVYVALNASPATWTLAKIVSGSQTNLFTGALATLNTGDTWTVSVIGSGFCLYYNGYLLAIESDSAIATGANGFVIYGATANSDAKIAAWSGGSFQATPAITFAISGNAGHAGALMSYSGTASGSVTADGSGNYSITGLSPGTYTITPSLAGFTFSPTSATEIYAGSDITGVNFTATANANISGNAGQAGATVIWGKDDFSVNGSVIADGSGNYTIPGLASGVYDVNPVLVGFTFSVMQAVTLSGSNVTGINFTSTPIPALTFTELAADPLNGVNISPLDPAKWTITTGFQGLKILNNVCQAISAAGHCAESYTAVAFPGNQYAEIKLASLVDDQVSAVFLSLLVDSTFGAFESVAIEGNGSGALVIFISSADIVFTLFAQPFSIGDVFRLAVFGNQVILYQNGVQIAGVNDPARPASGSPNIDLSPQTLLTDATVTNFAAGSVLSTMPLFNAAPNAQPVLLQPGQNGYFFGSYNANKPNPRFAITNTSGDGATATITVKQLEGFTPLVGDLITVTGTTRASGAFNVTNVALSAVALDPVSGVGTLQYASTGNAGSAADPGAAVVLNGEVGEPLVNGASQAVAIQTAAGQNDNGKNIAWAISYLSGPAPLAVTASLQGALVDEDSEYTTIASTTTLTSDNLVISNVTQRFYRVLLSGVNGAASKIVSKITI